MVIDGTNSSTTDNSRIGIELFFPDGTQIVDGDNDPGGLRDVYADDFLLLGVNNVDNGTYTLQFFVGYPPPQNEFGTYVLTIYCTTSSPTAVPSEVPTVAPTVAPTEPENITCSNDTYYVSGDYNDAVLTFYIEVTEDSNITIDARNSTIESGDIGLVGLEFKFSDGTTITDNDNDPGSYSDQYPDDFILLGVGDLDPGMYSLDYFVGYPPPMGYYGTFVLTVRCEPNPTPSPTPQPTVPPNSTCDTSSQTISGEYNDAILVFYITLEYEESDITIDARNHSGFSSETLVGIDLTFPDGSTVADGDNDPNVIGDEYPDDFLLLKVNNLTAGTYALNYYVGYPPPTDEYGDFVITFYCDTAAPTSSPTPDPTKTPTEKPTTVPTLQPTPRPTNLPSTSPSFAPTTASPTPSPVPTEEPTTTQPTVSPTTSEPTENPTTPSPTQPGVVTRGETISGEYNDDDVVFTAFTSRNCSLATFDASDSDVDGVTITITDQSGTVLGSGSDTVTISDLSAGTYNVTLTADDDEFGDFEFTFLCTLDTTTSTSTTDRPTRSPTTRPTYEPSPQPTPRPVRIVSVGGGDSDSSDDDDSDDDGTESGGGSDSGDSDDDSSYNFAAANSVNSVKSTRTGNGKRSVRYSPSDQLREDGMDIGGDDMAQIELFDSVETEGDTSHSEGDGVTKITHHESEDDIFSFDLNENGSATGSTWNVEHLEITLSTSALAMLWGLLIVFICCLAGACWVCRVVETLTGGWNTNWCYNSKGYHA